MASHEELSDLPELGPGKTPSGRARLPSSRPREKPQLSCNLCRRRKLVVFHTSTFPSTLYTLTHHPRPS